MGHPAITSPLPTGGVGWSAINEEEIQAIAELLRHPDRLFRYQGENKGQCDLLEQELAEKIGVRHSLFVTAGTAALTCCLSAFEIGPGDEVIVPGYTYIATAAAVVDVGAVPVIAEIDLSLGLDPDDVERKITPYTKAILVVHMQGVPARLARLREIARRHGIRLIEDCCQAAGATYQGVFCGVESDAFAWSTNFFKVLTSGEGGAFFCNDSEAFQRGVFQSDPAMQMWKSCIGSHESVPPFSRGGFRGSEIAAAMLRVQLRKLDALLAVTRQNKRQLLLHLNPPKHYTLQHVDDPDGECGISFAMIAHSGEEARQLVAHAAAEGLELGSVYNHGFPDRHIYSYWTSILEKRGATPAGYPWKDPAYKGSVSYAPDMCPQTLSILGRCLRLPININMNGTHIREIAEAINRADAGL
jgi:dTDP-4-amino-4,6-dideoxygalactose transaminase